MTPIYNMVGHKRRASSTEREALSPEKRLKLENLDNQEKQDDVDMVM